MALPVLKVSVNDKSPVIIIGLLESNYSVLSELFLLETEQKEIRDSMFYSDRWFGLAQLNGDYADCQCFSIESAQKTLGDNTEWVLDAAPFSLQFERTTDADVGNIATELAYLKSRLNFFEIVTPDTTIDVFDWLVSQLANKNIELESKGLELTKQTDNKLQMLGSCQLKKR